MAITPAELWPETILTTSVTVLVTAAVSGNGALLKRAVFTNATSSPATVTVYKVPSGASPITGNIVSFQFSVSAGEAWVPPELINMVVPPGGTIQALASVGATINTTGSGFTF